MTVIFLNLIPSAKQKQVEFYIMMMLEGQDDWLQHPKLLLRKNLITGFFALTFVSVFEIACEVTVCLVYSDGSWGWQLVKNNTKT